MATNTKAQARRLELETKERASKSERRHRVMIGKEPVYLKVFQVLNDLPRYRIDNGRIASEIDALKKDPKTAEILKDPFDDKAQDLIRDELKKLVKKANLERLITTSGVQEEPLILTRDGVVVNGNRRLTVLREHNIGNGFVDVCLLPDGVSEEEITLIEFRLQMDDPGKADYSWINQLTSIRRAVDRGISLEKIQASMPSLSKSEFEALRTSLDAIDLFLDRRGTPGRYGDIEEGKKFFFEELRKGVKKYKRSPEKVEAILWTAVNYYDYEPADPGEDRAFRKLNKAIRQVGRIHQAFGSSSVEDDRNDNPDDPLGGISASNSVYSSLRVNSETAEKIHDLVLAGEDQDARSKNAAQLFSDLQGMSRKMLAAEIDSKTSNIRGILEQLGLIEKQVKRLQSAAIERQKQAR